MASLANTTVVILGGSSGIGLATAKVASAEAAREHLRRVPELGTREDADRPAEVRVV